MSEPVLPEAFAALAPWVEDWALQTERARSGRRLGTAMAQLRAFYDAMLPHAEAALEHLKDFPCSDGPDGAEALPGPERRLLDLMLMLAEVAPAVEVFGQPAVVGGFDAVRFVPDHDASDWRISRSRRH